MFRRWLPLVFLALLPLVPLWRAVFLGEAIGPFDQIRQMTPWNGPKPSQPWDVLQADGVLQFFPWRDMVFESWGKGQLPAWNSYELAGTPLLANSQSAGLYPPHILLGFLHLPTAVAITLLAWFHLAWAGIGVYFLTRRLGGTRLGAILAGSSFSLSAFMIAWTALASVISTVAWIPWILACIVSLFREPPVLNPSHGNPFQQVFLQKRPTAVALAASVGMMLLAGHLQFAAYGLISAIVLGVGLIFVSPQVTLSLTSQSVDANGAPARPAKTLNMGSRGIALDLSIAALIFGALLAAPQILPVLAYGKFSHRQNTPTSEGYAGYVAGAIKPFELASLAIPSALGSPRAVLQVGGDDSLSQYWPAIVKNGDNFAESALSIGPLILIGLFLVPWKRRELWPLAAVGVLALLLSLGTLLNMPLYYLVPGWSATGSPGRVISIFVMCACTLGGLGLGAAVGGLGRPGVVKAACAMALGVLLAYVCPMIAPKGHLTADQLNTIQSVATASMLPTLTISIVLAGAAMLFLSNTQLAKYRPIAVLIPIALCWVGYGSNLLMTGKPLDKISGIPLQNRVSFVNEGWGLLSSGNAIAPPDTASLSRIHELGGYDSLIHRDTDALLHDIDGKDPAPEANGNMMFVKPDADPAKLAAAGVTYTWSKSDAAPQPLSGPGRCSLTGGTCQIVSEDYRSIQIEAEGSGTLTLRDRMMPGWTAQVDGRSVDMPEGIWRTIQISSPGTHRVVMRYTPPGLLLGTVFFACAAFALLIALLPKSREPISPAIVK